MPSHSFLLCTYNVLADSYILPSYFPDVEPKLLSPPWRRAALCAQLVALAADVYCLQEVEAPAFADFSAALAPLGLRGHYAPKGAGRPDGCAVFIRESLLQVRALRRLTYQDGPPDSGHVAQLVTVAPVTEPGRLWLIANSHIRYTAPGQERRTPMQQVDQLLAEALAEPAEARVLCGDFNLRPEDPLLAPLRDAGLRSIWDAEVQPTCFANGSSKCVDHVFYSDDLRAARGALRPLPAGTTLPAVDQPSDHLPILVRFHG